ncbi:replication initiator protein A [Pseudobutyrivibrio xylanivorans]|uniref:Replication initiator protein A (RepA) N-terminus n=1 Tax=Pseudobutyrivibrio xylanivorans DSM 14809 TaxID=1123012 RepID=A0A1M6C8X3_PSEXY|nr:replication initiator protein A [Pseudobutyrivibrio xylanivorans]SHI57500.1 Replication initiator protein A (RepA) N-terminus [Pseudobutyrivibrio xylanivorans DSM 14809]
MSKKYFYGRRQADLFSFIRIPKLLLTGKRYRKLSCEAKVLYGFLLDRMSLSAENEWFDDEGRVFVYCTISEAAEEVIGCGEKKACSVFKELEEIELIERKRQGLNKPNLIYVLDFSEEVSDGHFWNCPNDNSRNVDKSNQELSERQTNNTKFNKTEFSDTESSQVLSNDEGYVDEGRDRTRQDFDNYSAIRCYIANQISLDALRVDYSDNPLVDELYELIVDVVTSSKKEIVICGEKKPMSIVRSQFMKLNMFNIAFVLERLEETKPKIGNIKSYLLTTLYNSLLTTSSYYRTRCNNEIFRNEGGLTNE